MRACGYCQHAPHGGKRCGDRCSCFGRPHSSSDLRFLGWTPPAGLIRDFPGLSDASIARLIESSALVKWSARRDPGNQVLDLPGYLRVDDPAAVIAESSRGMLRNVQG